MLFFAASTWAQDEETRTLPFEIEFKKPIIIEVTINQSQGPAKFKAKEIYRLTPKKRQDDIVIYEAKTIGSELISLEGVPAFLSELLHNLSEEAKGLTYEYAADETGFPIELTKYKKINSFMKKMGKNMKKWARKFGKSEGLNDQQLAVMNGLVDQSIAPFLSDDPEVLGRLVLEQGQMMFFATGREFYVDYKSESKGTRYFEEGQAYFHTTDTWQLVNYDEEAGEAVVHLEQTLHPEEYQAFLVRYNDMLVEQHGAARQAEIDVAVDKYRQLKLTRSAEYTIDLATGLPSIGTIRSEKVFGGQSEIEETTFSMKYK